MNDNISEHPAKRRIRLSDFFSVLSLLLGVCGCLCCLLFPPFAVIVLPFFITRSWLLKRKAWVSLLITGVVWAACTGFTLWIISMFWLNWGITIVIVAASSLLFTAPLLSVLLVVKCAPTIPMRRRGIDIIISVILLVIFLTIALGHAFRNSTIGVYNEGVSALSALNTKIKVYQVERGHLPGCGLNGRNSYYDPQSNLSLQCLTQRLVNSPTGIFGLDENGNPVPGFTNMGPFQIDVDVDYDDFKGKFTDNSYYQYRTIKADDGTNGYAYVLAVFGSASAWAGTGHAIFTRFNPAEKEKDKQYIMTTWKHYRPEGTNVLVLTDQPSKPWHIPVPTFDMSVEEIRKLGWTAD